MMSTDLKEKSYKEESKHYFWYIFWCAISGFATGYGIYKASDHTEKAGYWRGIRTLTESLETKVK